MAAATKLLFLPRVYREITSVNTLSARETTANAGVASLLGVLSVTAQCGLASGDLCAFLSVHNFLCDTEGFTQIFGISGHWREKSV